MEIRPVVTVPIYAGIQTGTEERIDRWTNMTKLTGAFRDCVNGPKKLDYSCSKTVNLRHQIGRNTVFFAV